MPELANKINHDAHCGGLNRSRRTLRPASYQHSRVGERNQTASRSVIVEKPKAGLSWAFGVIVVRLVTGEHLFKSDPIS